MIKYIKVRHLGAKPENQQETVVSFIASVAGGFSTSKS